MTIGFIFSSAKSPTWCATPSSKVEPSSKTTPRPFPFSSFVLHWGSNSSRPPMMLELITRHCLRRWPSKFSIVGQPRFLAQESVPHVARTDYFRPISDFVNVNQNRSSNHDVISNGRHHDKFAILDGDLLADGGDVRRHPTLPTLSGRTRANAMEEFFILSSAPIVICPTSRSSLSRDKTQFGCVL